MLDLKVPKFKDKVVINTKKWVQNYDGSGLGIYRMSGRDLPTYLIKAEEVYDYSERFKGVINKGDLLFTSRISSEVCSYQTFELEDEGSYNSIPIMQVIGTFKENKVSFNNLTLLFDKILVQKKENQYKGFVLPNSNTFIGEVVKVGTNRFDKDGNSHDLRVSVGDTVLIRDNVTTEIYLDGQQFFATEEAMVVAIFNNSDYKLEEAEIISDSVLMIPYIPEKVGDSVFLTPNLAYEDLDMTDIYNRDLFKVVAVDSNLTKIQKDDILLLDRNITNYVYHGLDKYFIVSGMDLIEAKIEGE